VQVEQNFQERLRDAVHLDGCETIAAIEAFLQRRA
jgi:hypothetical protein